jgi:hypothetical protein
MEDDVPMTDGYTPTLGAKTPGTPDTFDGRESLVDDSEEGEGAEEGERDHTTVDTPVVDDEASGEGGGLHDVTADPPSQPQATRRMPPAIRKKGSSRARKRAKDLRLQKQAVKVGFLRGRSMAGSADLLTGLLTKSDLRRMLNFQQSLDSTDLPRREIVERKLLSPATTRITGEALEALLPWAELWLRHLTKRSVVEITSRRLATLQPAVFVAAHHKSLRCARFRLFRPPQLRASTEDLTAATDRARLTNTTVAAVEPMGSPPRGQIVPLTANVESVN